MKVSWFIAVICFSILNTTYGLNPGIRLNVTIEGLNQLESVAEPLITEYIEGMEPILLPNQYKSYDVMQVNITNLSLFDSMHTSFDFEILPNVGLRMTLGGLAARLSYEVGYQVFYTPFYGSFSGIATMNQSTVSVDFAMTTDSDGHLQAQINQIVLTIGFLDPGLSGLVETVAKVISPLIRYILEEVAPGYMVPTINSQLAGNLGNVTYTQFLDAQNLTVIDVSLLSPPTFAPEGIVIDIKGDIWADQIRKSCPLVAQPLPQIEDRNARFYLNEYVIDCFLIAYQESGALNTLVNNLIRQYLPLDNRMGLEFDFLNGTDIIITPQDVSALLSLETIVNKNVGFPEKFITIAINATADVDFSLNIKTPNVSVALKVNSLTTAFGVLQTAEDFPAKYEEQIRNTNFTDLALQADTFVATNVLPSVNQQLASGFAIPEYVSKYLLNPELSPQQGCIFVGTDLYNPDKQKK